mgnify:CR=1 FL=1
MPRRREVPKRDILPDPLYHSVDVSKFVNVMMLDGKKAVAERMLYGAFEQISRMKLCGASIPIFWRDPQTWITAHTFPVKIAF